MSLGDIREGTRVLLDANVIIYALQRASLQSVALLERCAQGNVEGVITTTILAEICHRRMIQEAQHRGLVGSNPARHLSVRRDLIRQLDAYGNDVRDLLGGGLVVESSLPEDFYVALEFQRQFGLLTIDSLNLAAARRLGLFEVATAARNFDAVRGFTVYQPTDIIV